MPQKESTTVPTHLIFESVARRIDAGTYLPRLPRTIEVPAVSGRPMREYILEIAVCAISGGLIGYLLGGGAQ